MTQQFITARVHPSKRHLVTEDAALTDLGLCQLDLLSVACDIEEAHGFMFPGDPEARWQTVGDVMRDVERMA